MAKEWKNTGKSSLFVIVSEELIRFRGEQPIARIYSEQPSSPTPRVPGSAQGRLTILSDNDDHLTDFSKFVE